MKVAVFAGTDIDTKMGADFLEREGIETISYPLSKNPEEQTKMQYFSKEKLEELVTSKIEEGKEKGIDKVLIYCNSLSSAIDYEKIAVNTDIEIITPLESYLDLGDVVKGVAILAANGISAYKVDKLINEAYINVQTISIGNLSIVKEIETAKDPADIIKDLALDRLIQYIESIKIDEYKIDSLILACTHFSYIADEIKKITDLEVIDPSEDMVRRILD